MTTAPARDLMLSQAARSGEAPSDFFLPRACETTLDAMEHRRGERLERMKSPWEPAAGKGLPAANAEGRAASGTPLRCCWPDASSYFRCLLTSFVISNIDTWPLPPKMGFRLSSALMLRRFF